ncbi:DUF7344 domain-containing protein (plasmid) [Haloarcula salina]|uniref:DUF7344 domain-containing protein n=1 Tax=Haloarcula salina TaxID=1429914 RepID=UPI003C70609C
MTDSELSLDTIHELIASRRRRYTLYCLYLYANPMRLADVAGRATEWEHGTPASEFLDERLAMYTSLVHIHVPKLAAADVIAYDRSDEMLELDRNAAQLRPYLERAAEIDLDETDISPL